MGRRGRRSQERADQGLAIVTPGVLGPDYFRDVAAVLGAGAGGAPEFAAIAAAMRRHGLTPAP